MTSGKTIFDIAVIGGGLAGIAATMTGVKIGCQTLLVDQYGSGHFLSKYLPFGLDFGFGRILLNTSSSLGAELRDLTSVDTIEIIENEPFQISATDRKKFLAKTIIIATGAIPRKLGVPNEDNIEYGVHYSEEVFHESSLYKGRKVAVVGSGRTAVFVTQYLEQIAREVYLINENPDLLVEVWFSGKNITLLNNTQVIELREKKDHHYINGLIVKNKSTGKTERLQVKAIFIAKGYTPNTVLAQQCGIKCDQDGYIKVDKYQRTNVDRIYACGDVIADHQIAYHPIIEGTTAALTAAQELVKSR